MIITNEDLYRLFVPFAIMDENDEIIGFTHDITAEAKEAARMYFERCEKFDDVSNWEYWEKLKAMVKEI